MYESYSRQSLPPRDYRELLGSAICVFNANNQFIIENILRIDNVKYNWYELIDKTSGQLKDPVSKTFSDSSSPEIVSLFENLVSKRNRIIHSFQIAHLDQQILCTKDKDYNQFIISEEYLLDFIKENENLSIKLHEFRGY